MLSIIKFCSQNARYSLLKFNIYNQDYYSRRNSLFTPELLFTTEFTIHTKITIHARIYFQQILTTQQSFHHPNTN